MSVIFYEDEKFVRIANTLKFRDKEYQHFNSWLIRNSCLAPGL